VPDYSVLFCESRVAAYRESVGETVVAWPVEPKWNDFSFGFQAKARLTSGRQGANSMEVELLIVPWPVREYLRFDTWLRSLAPPNGVQSAGELQGRFFSILRSEQEYRRLVEWIGENEDSMDSILRPLRDVVYFRSRLLERDALNTFLQSEAAKRGVFRREATYLAWHRGVRILSGEPGIPIEDARSPLSFEATLPGFTGPHSLSIRFGVPAPLRDRCHALIGKNGVGKSQLLRELLIVLGQRIDGTQVDPFTSSGEPRARDSSLEPQDYRVARIVALSWDSDSVFPEQSRLDSKLQYLHFPMRDDSSDTDEPAGVSASDTLASQLIQLFRENAAGASDGFSRLRRTLQPLYDVLDLAVALHPAIGPVPEWITLRAIQGAYETQQLDYFGRLLPYFQPTRLDDAGEKVALSSGERVFLNFGIRCAARVQRGTLLLLDEPETHLHPNLISDFMRILTSMLESTNSIAILATHSPFIVRELPSRCVHVVRLDSDRSPQISNAFLRTFGASIDRLAADIFDDADSSQLNQEIADVIANSGESSDQIREVYGRELSPELMSDIRQRIRDQIQ
jgi:ABC-type branched-subunit amino acid transport system ATPase component